MQRVFAQEAPAQLLEFRKWQIIYFPWIILCWKYLAFSVNPLDIFVFVYISSDVAQTMKMFDFTRMTIVVLLYIFLRIIMCVYVQESPDGLNHVTPVAKTEVKKYSFSTLMR